MRVDKGWWCWGRGTPSCLGTRDDEKGDLKFPLSWEFPQFAKTLARRVIMEKMKFAKDDTITKIGQQKKLWHCWWLYSDMSEALISQTDSNLARAHIKIARALTLTPLTHNLSFPRWRFWQSHLSPRDIFLSKGHFTFPALKSEWKTLCCVFCVTDHTFSSAFFTLLIANINQYLRHNHDQIWVTFWSSIAKIVVTFW